jgi:L-ascorbate metabolism protein UlaG (beta-lactamase superfamily)
MGPSEAARAVELLGADTVVPMHYGTFPVLTGTPDQLREALAARGLGSVQVLAPQPGGRVA